MMEHGSRVFALAALDSADHVRCATSSWSRSLAEMPIADIRLIAFLGDRGSGKGLSLAPTNTITSSISTMVRISND